MGVSGGLSRMSSSRMNTMPSIPEDIEICEKSLSGENYATQLLDFVLQSEPEHKGEYESSNEEGELISQKSPDSVIEGMKILGVGYEENINVLECHGENTRKFNINISKTEHNKASADGWGMSFLRAGKVNRVHCVVDIPTESVDMTCDQGRSENTCVPGEPLSQLLQGKALSRIQSGLQTHSHTSPKQCKVNRLRKGLEVGIFVLLNVFIIAALSAAAILSESLVAALTIAILGGISWAFVFVANVAVATKPEFIIRKICEQREGKQLNKLEEGKVVAVTGVASKTTYSVCSNFEKSGDYLLVDTFMRSISQGPNDVLVSKVHVRQTKAVNFRITETGTNMAVLVAAKTAADSGLLAPFVRLSRSFPMKVPLDLFPWLGLNKLDMSRNMDNAQLKIQEGYVSDSEVVTVIGILAKQQNQFVILPLNEQRNLSWIWLFNIIPFFCPVWVSGLVVTKF